MDTKPKAVSATGLIVTGAGRLCGIIVSSHSSGTLKLEDSVGGGQNQIMGTYTFAAGSHWLPLTNPIKFENGLYATVGGTLAAQVLIG